VSLLRFLSNFVNSGWNTKGSSLKIAM
jgi:hypothetical protein